MLPIRQASFAQSSPVPATAVRLRFPLCPGDTLVGTAAIEALHQQYPGRYQTDVCGTAAEAIFENNPCITKLPASVPTVTMEYPLIHSSNQRPVHFIQGFTDFLASSLGISLVPIRYPVLHLSEEEKAWVSQVQEGGWSEPYWLVCSGYKSDYPVKNYGVENYQRVVSLLKDRVQFVQVGSLEHVHKPLQGVIDLRGKTDTRQLIRLAWNAQGGLGGVSFLHHIFAAFRKPFVTVASGMESRAWEEYPTGRMLSRHGTLPCCRTESCWRSKVQGDASDKSRCELPVVSGDEIVPKCMDRISSYEVAGAVLSYITGGVCS